MRTVYVIDTSFLMEYPDIVSRLGNENGAHIYIHKAITDELEWIKNDKKNIKTAEQKRKAAAAAQELINLNAKIGESKLLQKDKESYLFITDEDVSYDSMATNGDRRLLGLAMKLKERYTEEDEIVILVIDNLASLHSRLNGIWTIFRYPFLPWDDLRVKYQASKEDIKRAWRNNIKRYHFDMVSSRTDLTEIEKKYAEERSKRVNNAYSGFAENGFQKFWSDLDDKFRYEYKGTYKGWGNYNDSAYNDASHNSSNSSFYQSEDWQKRKKKYEEQYEQYSKGAKEKYEEQYSKRESYSYNNYYSNRQSKAQDSYTADNNSGQPVWTVIFVFTLIIVLTVAAVKDCSRMKHDNGERYAGVKLKDAIKKHEKRNKRANIRDTKKNTKDNTNDAEKHNPDVQADQYVLAKVSDFKNVIKNRAEINDAGIITKNDTVERRYSYIVKEMEDNGFVIHSHGSGQLNQKFINDTVGKKVTEKYVLNENEKSKHLIAINYKMQNNENVQDECEWGGAIAVNIQIYPLQRNEQDKWFKPVFITYYFTAKEDNRCKDKSAFKKYAVETIENIKNILRYWK